MKVKFGTTSVQANRRIALDQNLLENMGLSEGDQVRLYYDTDNHAIVIENPASSGRPKHSPVIKNGR